MSEDRLQQECYMFFHNNYPKLRGLMFHVPNGGSRNAREGAKFKTMGVIRGVSDFLFIYQSNLYAIELKTISGRQSVEQLNWAQLVSNEGVHYLVVRSLDDFKDLIDKIIK
tara:strand:- start:7371 stop:7703 length:333 start_codon:yes stop_codon:yes gene_type:complete